MIDLMQIGYCPGTVNFLESLNCPGTVAESAGSSPNRHMKRTRSTCIQMLFASLGLVLCASLPALSASARATRVSTRTRRRASRTIYGVPTFAASSLEDIDAFDDQGVRKAAAGGLWRYN